MKSFSRSRFLQSLKENEFTELVLVPLLERMGYEQIQITHGTMEYGKDIVFSRPDPLDLTNGRRHLSATVKAHPLSGSVAGSQAIREVYHQVRQSLTEPFISPFDGSEIKIDRVYVITSHPIAQTTIHSIKSELQLLENRVYFLSGPDIITLLEVNCPDLLSSLPDPEARYIQTLARRFLQNQALGYLGARNEVGLLDIYTGGDLSPTSPDQAQNISFAFPEISTKKVWLRDLIESDNFIIILADVGSGKTTLLQKFALELIESRENNSAGLLPLFIPLHMLPAQRLTSLKTFLSEIEEYVRTRESISDFTIRDRASSCVLLLDGFDELSMAHDEIARILPQLTESFPGGIFLTSRPSRIPLVTDKFVYFRLNPFDDHDIQTFLSKWFAGEVEQQERIYIKILSDWNLRDFCRNPLMLTLYCILACRYTVDEIPHRKTDVYASISTILLGDWDHFRKIHNRFSPALKEYALEVLAFRLHKQREKQIPVTSVLEVIREIFLMKGIDERPHSMLDEILYRSSLIRPNVSGKLEFAHLSFQEFFCARHLLRSADKRKMQDLLYDDWWRNALVFYFGLRRNMEGIVVSMSGRSRGKGIRLMEYLAEADYTDPETRIRIYKAVSVDVLYSGNLSRGDIDVCLRGGPELVRAIGERLEESPGNVNKANYLRLLAIQDVDNAIQMLGEAAQLAKSLSIQDQFLVLSDGLRITSKRKGAEVFLEYIDGFVYRFRETIHSPQTARVAIGLFRKLKKSVLAEVDAGRVDRESAGRIVHELSSAAEKIAYEVEENFVAEELLEIARSRSDADLASEFSLGTGKLFDALKNMLTDGGRTWLFVHELRSFIRRAGEVGADQIDKYVTALESVKAEILVAAEAGDIPEKIAMSIIKEIIEEAKNLALGHKNHVRNRLRKILFPDGDEEISKYPPAEPGALDL